MRGGGGAILNAPAAGAAGDLDVAGAQGGSSILDFALAVELVTDGIDRREAVEHFGAFCME